MKLNTLDRIKIPSLVLDEVKAKRNLRSMAEKAAARNIRFRPHFKTHQSARIGEWFREAGVKAITVSSLDMAAYFAKHGWRDILVAFPVNLREIETIQRLANEVHLGLLVESERVIEILAESLQVPLDVWIKVDTGLHRAGIDHQDVGLAVSLAEKVKRCQNFCLRGLLTHAGQTYHTHSVDEIKRMYAQSCMALNTLRQALNAEGIDGLEVSVGDTPGCWLSADLGDVDEIRPGNFIFFDAMMFELGVCDVQDIAVAVACPVVCLHPRSNEVIIYGGAVHLSKEAIEYKGKSVYGFVAIPSANGWRFAGK